MSDIFQLIPIANAHSEEGSSDGDMGDHMFSATGFSYMSVFMIVFWILIAVGVVYLVKHSDWKGDKTPLDVLKSRYASGEIDKKEFDVKKKDLSS